ncbi:unnamed protein product [Caenorhabditis nigoni]
MAILHEFSHVHVQPEILEKYGVNTVSGGIEIYPHNPVAEPRYCCIRVINVFYLLTVIASFLYIPIIDFTDLNTIMFFLVFHSVQVMSFYAVFHKSIRLVRTMLVAETLIWGFSYNYIAYHIVSAYPLMDTIPAQTWYLYYLASVSMLRLFTMFPISKYLQQISEEIYMTEIIHHN